MFSRRIFLTLMSGMAAAPSFAANLVPPSGRVLLTITGAIRTTNQDGAAMFDRDMMEGLDWRTIKTYTNYTDGLQTFSGPTLASVLAASGASGAVLHATALDDYTVDIPLSDLDEHEIILAMDQNGKPMRVRDKGPIWVIYPAPTMDDIGPRQISHSIWQLKSIDVQ